jgi:hypothetical protein
MLTRRMQIQAVADALAWLLDRAHRTSGARPSTNACGRPNERMGRMAFVHSVLSFVDGHSWPQNCDAPF